ncbi:MAG: hypothetical protein ACR2G0_09850 [Chthoniobacterales bacterium]
MLFRAVAILLALSLAAQACIKEVDFSHYETPLYGQIVDRIKARVSARLGPGRNTHDRYFIIPFAYQNRGNDPAFSHSFVSVIRVLSDSQQTKLTPGLKKRKEANREFEAFTISWLPHDFMRNPNLCVFDGVLSNIFPQNNHCPVVRGRNFNLEDTIKIAVSKKVAVAMWGPYEIRKGGFDLGVKRKKLLEGGTIGYRADDRLYREGQVAINCFHAMAGLDQPFPDGGLFGTGFKIWGFNGTARVLLEYTEKARYNHLLLEPVDVENDRYGFVYAPSREGEIPYVPFRHSSAFKR